MQMECISAKNYCNGKSKNTIENFDIYRNSTKYNTLPNNKLNGNFTASGPRGNK